MTEDELILTHILQCSRSRLLLDKPTLNSEQQKQFEIYKTRREKGEPLQYILGTCEFVGVELKVDPRVLIPRPETEILVDEAMRRIKGLKNIKILDLGTGSGNIAIALSKVLTTSLVTALDISQDALDLAYENAAKIQVHRRIRFVHQDMKDYLTMSQEQFDLIISNPPYIPTHQMAELPMDVKKEPRIALEAGEDGLKFYRDIIKYTPPLLRGGAYLMMEFGDGQGPAIKDLIVQQHAFSRIQILQDLTGKDRIICAQKI